MKSSWNTKKFTENNKNKSTKGIWLKDLTLACLILTTTACGNDVDRKFAEPPIDPVFAQFSLNDFIRGMTPSADQSLTPGKTFQCAVDLEKVPESVTRLELQVFAQPEEVLESLETSDLNLLAQGIEFPITVNEIGKNLGCRLIAETEQGESFSQDAGGDTSIQASDDLELSIKSLVLGPEKARPGQKITCKAGIDWSAFEVSTASLKIYESNRSADLITMVAEESYSSDIGEMGIEYQTPKDSRAERFYICEISIQFDSGEEISGKSNLSLVSKNHIPCRWKTLASASYRPLNFEACHCVYSSKSMIERVIEPNSNPNGPLQPVDAKSYAYCSVSKGPLSKEISDLQEAP